MARAMLLVALLASCQSTAPAPGDSPPRPVPPGDYPDLASVPPRPQLSYTVEQRRAIGNQLVADRANARYRAAELAYATGATSEPPVPAVADVAQPAGAVPAPVAPVGDPGIARAYVRSDLTIAADRGKLRQLMRRLEQPAPDPVGPASLVEAVGLIAPSAVPAPADGAEVPTAAAPSNALDRFGDYLGGLLGFDDGAAASTEATVVVATPLPLGSVVARVPFANRSVDLAAGAEDQLGRALEQARVADATLRIVGASSQTGMGLDRARAVAQGLMRLGAPADQLAVAAGGSGDEVVVYLAPRHAS